MATANSATNLITMNAQSDGARATSKIRVAGVMALGNSATAVSLLRLTDAAGVLDIVPLVKAKTAALALAINFDPPVEVLGLLCKSLSNVSVTVRVK